MKTLKLFLMLPVVAALTASCDLLSTGNEDNDPSGSDAPTEGSGGVDLSDARQVKSIEMTYTNNCEPVEVSSYTLDFAYNDKGQCTKLTMDFPEDDDLVCDVAYGSSTITFNITGYNSPVSYLATIENGRAVSTTYSDPDENRLMTFGYDKDGYLYKLTEWCPSHMNFENGCGFVTLTHDDGLCTGAYFDVHPESASSPEDALLWAADAWYPNRYSSYKTNIDLNAIIVDGGIEFEFGPHTLLTLFRYMGKLSDCLFERTYAFESYAESVVGGMSGFSEPDTRYDRSYTTYKEVSESYPLTISADADGYPVEVSYTKKFQKYRVDYYYQTTDEYLGNGYAYTRSEDTYTKIGDEVSCPVSMKISY